jgi:hypothetical protein
VINDELLEDTTLRSEGLAMNADDATAMYQEISAKLLLPDDELFVEVGQSLGKGATFTDAKARGRQVVENLKRELRASVCSSPKIIACYNGSKTDAVQVVAAIIDVIAGALHGIPPATIAILLYRTGLTAYCGSHWPPGDETDERIAD